MKESKIQSSSGKTQKVIRYSLGSLLAFIALNAFGGGFYGMSGAEALSTELLEGSPFRSYFIPGLILFVVIGGVFLFASIAVFARFSIARKASVAAVIIVLIWLIVQIAIIGYVSWLQPVTAIVALIVYFLAWFLPKQTPA